MWAYHFGKFGPPQLWSNFLTDISTSAAVLVFEVEFPYRRIWEVPARRHRQLPTKKEELKLRTNALLVF